MILRPLLLALLASISPAAQAQPAFGTHEPRSYDPRIIPNFSFEVIEIETRGRLGVFALDTGTGQEAGWAEHQDFPLHGTLNFLACGAALELAERSVMPPDTEDLCQAAVALNDTAAADWLLYALGGPAALSERLASWGDRSTTLAPDTAARGRITPEMTVHHLNHLLLGNTLNPASRQRLLNWMHTSSGRDHPLRASLPHGWLAAIISATGADGSSATSALIQPVCQPPLLIAIFIENSTLPIDQSMEIDAEITRILTENTSLPCPSAP